MIRKKAVAFVAVMSVLLTTPALALEYSYEGERPGQDFYTTTSESEKPIENSAEITLGDDGTITGGTNENRTEEPLSQLQTPVGEYPEAWGSETDVAIAANSVFPNALAPTTQQSGLGDFVQYQTIAVSSGALPTKSTMTAGQGTYGMATEYAPLPALTKGGAIAKLYIPRIGMTRYVYEGATLSNMRRGVGHFSCTPGWDGNICIAGHNRGTKHNFWGLYDLNTGDLIQYTTAYGTRTYQVSNITMPYKTDITGLYQDGSNKLTLYTCVPDKPEIDYCVVATLVE